MKKIYEIEHEDLLIEIPEQTRRQIILDHLEKYYIGALVCGTFIIGFLLGVIAHAA